MHKKRLNIRFLRIVNLSVKVMVGAGPTLLYLNINRAHHNFVSFVISDDSVHTEQACSSILLAEIDAVEEEASIVLTSWNHTCDIIETDDVTNLMHTVHQDVDRSTDSTSNSCQC